MDENMTASEVDSTSENTSPVTSQTEQEGEPSAPDTYKTFTTKQEYQEHIDGIIGDRISEYRTLKSDKDAREKQDKQSEKQIFSKIASEVGQLKKDDPDLFRDANYSSLMTDVGFVTLLNQGFSVRDAYLALNLNSTLKTERARVAESIRKKSGGRPTENVTSSKLTGGYKNPANMSDQELDAIKTAVQSGRRVVL